MEQGFPADGIDHAQHLAELDFVSYLDGHRSELAIEGEVAAVLHKDAVIVARHDHYLLDHPSENGLEVFGLTARVTPLLYGSFTFLNTGW